MVDPVLSVEGHARRGKAQDRWQLFRWWRRVLLEVALLFLVVVVGEILLGDGRIGSYGVHPHPYWLVVLPMASSRGVVAGLVASIVASALYVWGAHGRLPDETLQSLIAFEHLMEPLLFVSAGFVVGEFRDVIGERMREQAARLSDVQSAALKFRKQRDVLAEANLILETRVVDQSAQFGNLIVAATRLERATRREVYGIALELVEEHCGAAASMLVPMSTGELDFAAFRGWPEEERAQRIAAARASPLVQRALEHGDDVNGFAQDEEPPREGPVVVVPLVDRSGVVFALLCMDELPLSRVNPSTVRTFLAIAEWISALLVRFACASAAAAAGGGPTLDLSESRVGSVEELGDRLRIEYERSTRHGEPLGLIAVQFEDWADGSAAAMARLDRHVRRTLAGGLRSSDTVYRFGYPGCYLVVLAATPVGGAEVVRRRLERRVARSPHQQFGRVRTEAAGPGPDAPDPHSVVARFADEFRARSQLPLGRACPVTVPAATSVATLGALGRRLRSETNLAARGDTSLNVVSIVGSTPHDADAEQLASHVDQAAVDTLRPTDGAYEVGPNHVALVLPNTRATEAERMAARFLELLATRVGAAAYGSLDARILSFGSTHPDAGAFLEALRSAGPVEALRRTASID